MKSKLAGNYILTEWDDSDETFLERKVIDTGYSVSPINLKIGDTVFFFKKFAEDMIINDIKSFLIKENDIIYVLKA